MNAKSIIIAAGLVALSVADARADLKLTVKTRQPSRVFLNGSRHGRAPVSFKRIRPGVHWVDVQNLRNGAFRRVKVVSPRYGRSHKVVKVNFRRRNGVKVSSLPVRSVKPWKVNRHGRSAYGKYGYRRPVYSKYGKYGNRRSVYGKYGYGKPVIYRPVAHKPVIHTPVYRVPPSDCPVTKEHNRGYVRKRNTLLALGAANELFNRGADKKEMRGALAGATVLNAILNK